MNQRRSGFERAMRRGWLAAALASAAALTTAFAADIAGSRDHPLISRYEGSVITHFAEQAFGEYGLVIAPVGTREGRQANPDSVRWLEGRLTQIQYKAPDGRSTLEILRNYEQALAAAGFRVLFACKNQECDAGNGRYFSYTVARGLMFGEYQDQRYLAARLARAAGDVYVALYLNQNHAAGQKFARIQLDVVELAPMEAGLVTVDAAAMRQELTDEGRVALYGIYFDTDKAEIKPESEPTLAEVAKLLQQDPQLKLVVVGHTDNRGGLDYNMSLSRRRAEAVKGALVERFGIDPGRLEAWGVAYLSPVATNRTDEGRAQNRRVELVEQ